MITASFLPVVGQQVPGSGETVFPGVDTALRAAEGIAHHDDRTLLLLLAFAVIIGLGFLFWQQRRAEAKRNDKTDSDLAELRAQALKWSDEKTRVIERNNDLLDRLMPLIEQCIATLGPRESGYHAPPRRRGAKPPGGG